LKTKIFWNQNENRIRAGWRILIQILLTAIPLAVLGLGGFYSEGNQNLRVALTAGPITVLSVLLCSRFIDKRKISDLGICLGEKGWWSDLGFGTLAGFLSASALILLLKLFGWAEVVLSGQLRFKLGPFIGSFLVALLTYLVVGIFEELMRVYQIKNAAEGLAGTKLSLIGVGLLAVLLGAAWSIVGHLASRDLSFLVYVLVTAVIYGLYFLWTGRAALAVAVHFAWDLTLSSIFQLGATSEASVFYVRLGEMPDLWFEITSLLGITAKMIGLLLVLFWIGRKEGRILIKPRIAASSLWDL
jgi:membrane protease YdiL (CAAX protease family)